MQFENYGTIIVHNHYYGQVANSDKSIEPLRDTIKGKPQPWRKKKRGGLQIAHAMREVGEHMNKKANRVWWCGDVLSFTDEGERKRLYAAQFCRERLCIMCSWRKSIKMFYNLSRVLDTAQVGHMQGTIDGGQELISSLETVFLTLTVKNCVGHELPALLDTMFAGWKRMQENRRFRDNIKGFFRALEVTYNAETDMYHPHFHAIMLVDKQYFHGKQYMQTADWSKLWGKSCRLEYTPVCDIRAVRTGKDRKYKHVAEVAKYTVKDSDIIHEDEALTAKVVEVLDTALYRRRLFAYGGILYKIAKQLDAENPEAGDLVNIRDEVMREDVAATLMSYKWDFGLQDYIRT